MLGFLSPAPRHIAPCCDTYPSIPQKGKRNSLCLNLWVGVRRRYAPNKKQTLYTKRSKMGCDIHTLIERKVGDKWVTEIIGDFEQHAIENRNYGVFAALAGVRDHDRWSDNEPPHGFPTDASDTARMLFEDWSGDAHTPSYLPLDVAWRAYTRGCKRYEGCEAQPQWKVFGVEDGDDFERRLVFWFDN